jgi:hypothetical protein
MRIFKAEYAFVSGLPFQGGFLFLKDRVVTAKFAEREAGSIKKWNFGYNRLNQRSAKKSHETRIIFFIA